MADIQRDKGHNKITYAGSLETVLVSVVKEGEVAETLSAVNSAALPPGNTAFSVCVSVS